MQKYHYPNGSSQAPQQSAEAATWLIMARRRNMVDKGLLLLDRINLGIRDQVTGSDVLEFLEE